MPPYNDVRVRQAIASAIDRAALVEFYNSYWPGRSYIPATNYVPRDILGFDLYGVVGHPYNPEHARNLLAQSGYPNGDGFPTITIAHFPSENNRISAVHIAEMLNDVLGIEVLTRGFDDPNEILTNPPGLFHYSWSVDIAIEPYTWLYTSICGNFDNDYILSEAYEDQNRAIQNTQDWFSKRELLRELSDKVCQGGWDPQFHWNNTQYNGLLEDAINEANAESRKSLYVQAEIILVETDVVLIPLGHFRSE
jgi:oligopeptide transport system substrate-binding protein